jgi:5-methylthioribose kinase
MLELTPDNTLDYLRSQGRLGPGPARVEALGWGVSNAVLRVHSADGPFVLKQSRPQLRTRDAWFSDLDRVYREEEVMRLLGPLLPPLTVPQVLFSDRANFVFAMAHAPFDSRVWKEQLLAGDVDLSVSRRAGAILGRIHQATAERAADLERFRDPSVFVQLRVDPFYRRVQERRPEVADQVAPLIEQLLTRREALCHGDFSPKNLLVHGEGLTLVDYETAYFGDPAMDLGFCLSHLLLKAFHRPDDLRRRGLTNAFWEGYFQEATFRPAAELEARGVGHCAVCMLARIDGTSPVDYLSEEPKRDAVRELGRRLLLDGVRRWGEALERAAAFLQQRPGTGERRVSS